MRNTGDPVHGSGCETGATHGDRPVVHRLLLLWLLPHTQSWTRRAGGWQHGLSDQGRPRLWCKCCRAPHCGTSGVPHRAGLAALSGVGTEIMDCLNCYLFKRKCTSPHCTEAGHMICLRSDSKPLAKNHGTPASASTSYTQTPGTPFCLRDHYSTFISLMCNH